MGRPSPASQELEFWQEPDPNTMGCMPGAYHVHVRLRETEARAVCPRPEGLTVWLGHEDGVS